jgi:biotin carboxyl carrier protein
MSKRGGKKNTSVSTGASEAIMSRAYRSVAHETPPPELDARILAHAREAVGSTDTPARSRNRWALPLSVAAVMVLSVSVVINIALKPDEQELYNLTSAVTLHEQAEMRDEPASPRPAKRSVAKLAEKRESESLALSQDTAREAPAAAAPAPTEAAPAVESMARAKAKADYAEADRASAGVSAASKPAPVRAPSAAAVVSVTVEGNPGAYWFSVGVRSQDTGCDQYADWWEIVGENGTLLYRYVLTHSHTDKQPFVLDGGPVRIQPEARVWVRAHMNKTGYGSSAFVGSVNTGFAPVELAPNFAIGLAKQAPLPDGCAY